MAIPRQQENVPPPLPPPRQLPEISAARDPGWQWGNGPDCEQFGQPVVVRPESSLIGPTQGGVRREEVGANVDEPHTNHGRRRSSISTDTSMDDQNNQFSNTMKSVDDASATRQMPCGLQSEGRLQHQDFVASGKVYDQQLLKLIGGPNSPNPRSISSSTNETNDVVQQARADVERQSSTLPPLTMPDRTYVPVASSFGSTIPSTSAVSPRSAGQWSDRPLLENKILSPGNIDSVFDEANCYRMSNEALTFQRNDAYTEEGRMGSLNLADRLPHSPKAGSKRRALSPPLEHGDRSSVSSTSGPSELHRIRPTQQAQQRNSPISRLHALHSSVSSASSLGPPHGSLGSSTGLSSVSSSATSYASEGRSPSNLAPPLNQRPKANVACRETVAPTQSLTWPHQREASDNSHHSPRRRSTDGPAHSRTSSLSQAQSVLMCECCPKKPKKFDTEQDLRAHECEKQYTCAYCPNRFKNKNEAERHQNSLHLRFHSWSCASLPGIEAAFHASGKDTDVCGYCGDEFANPPRWDVRAEHLNHVHKFGECNQAKKFFRADHFRQHLKHSHQGSSGKWTNSLENACMKDEPPPEPRRADTTTTAVPDARAHLTPMVGIMTASPERQEAASADEA